jgi:hypothetical protein
MSTYNKIIESLGLKTLSGEWLSETKVLRKLKFIPSNLLQELSKEFNNISSDTIAKKILTIRLKEIKKSLAKPEVKEVINTKKVEKVEKVETVTEVSSYETTDGIGLDLL